MIHNAMKRILALILAVLTLTAIPRNAAAVSDFDLNKTGSIRICLRDKDRPEETVGGTLQLIKVGAARETDHNLTFVLEEAFVGSGISLADLSAPELPRQLADYASRNSLTGITVQTNANGAASFTGLSAGVYLVTQIQTESNYYAVSPFLVTLPMYDNGWIYNIEAEPKVQRPPQTVDVEVIKKWLDNSKSRPKELVVQLIQDGVVQESVTLNEENQWRYTWKGLDGYAKWEVKESEVPAGYTASYSVSGNTTTITNRAQWYVPPKDPNKLTQTGQLNWPVPVLASSGIFLLAVGVLLRKGRKKDHDEA